MITHDLHINLEIPIPYDANLVFHEWLPLQEADVLTVETGNLQVRLWLDLHCTWHGKMQLSEIEKYDNIDIRKLYADVIAKGIPAELVEFIYEERDRPRLGPKENPDASYVRLRQDYIALGRQVLDTVLNAFNRLILYARIHKGQYWLKPRPVSFESMTSDFNEFKAKVKVESREWIRWYPASIDSFTAVLKDSSRFVSKTDWPAISEFIRGQNRPNLVLELLANAESLAQEGHTRSAIVEAVAALEVATARFSKSPKLDNVLSERIDAQSLQSQVEHLGFSGSLRYLVPLLLGKEVLPTTLLHQCYRAVEMRGNVAHQGQREIDEETLLPLLRAIRHVCTILMQFTKT
jgi:hypothetical protein